MEILKQKKHVTTKFLAKELYCSVSTVRRDLIKLEKEGLVKRFHGGASIVPDTKVEYNYISNETENLKEKKYICNIALDFIQDGQTIFIDSSTTANNLCPLLEKFDELTVITNGIKTAYDLNFHENVQAFFAGGIIKPGTSATIGEFAFDFLEHFHADITFISCRGLNQDGVFDVDYNLSLTKKKNDAK